MADRVVTTPEARDAIKKIQRLIESDYESFLTAIKKEASTLSDPNRWDGPLAGTFRQQTWPETEKALRKAQTELGELRAELEKIAANISKAGGSQ